MAKIRALVHHAPLLLLSAAPLEGRPGPLGLSIAAHMMCMVPRLPHRAQLRRKAAPLRLPAGP